MYECVGEQFPGGSAGKESACNAGHVGDAGLIPGLGRSPGERHSPHSPPEFLPGESHGQRSLKGYSPQGHKELDMPEATQHARMWMCN